MFDLYPTLCDLAGIPVPAGLDAKSLAPEFYQMAITYFAEDGMLYWMMGAPLEKTIIINRCKEEDSFENRRKNGTLPEEKRTQGQKAEGAAPLQTPDIIAERAKGASRDSFLQAMALIPKGPVAEGDEIP